jgi:hypothetical protein
LARFLPRRRATVPAHSPDLLAAAFDAAPRLFGGDPAEVQRRCPDAVARTRRAAARFLDGEVVIFGRSLPLVGPITERDPKWAWERSRAGHLVEVAAATRLCPDLAAPVSQAIARAVEQAEVPRDVPLEVALSAIHHLAAIELIGVDRLPPRGRSRLAARLLSDAAFMQEHLEDGGVVPANHLLADWVGLLFVGLALSALPALQPLRRAACAGVLREAKRQVAADGAHFEASTGYHRFALELLLSAHLYGRSAGIDLGLQPTLRRMFRFVRGTVMPDGHAPGFGDGDDARVAPIRPRGPREEAYLLSIGAALFGDAGLALGDRPSEEAVWLLGPAFLGRLDPRTSRPDPPVASFPEGGIHVLRRGRTYVAMRAGSTGQRGVGGHGHNDPLSLVVHHRGRTVLFDSGTGTYTGDPIARDRFRGVAAHSTLVVGGAEPSPILEDRPFALVDRARATARAIDDHTLSGSHRGYRRLPQRVTHHRTLSLGERGLRIEDHLDGRGTVEVAARFQVRRARAIDPRSAAIDGATLRLAAGGPLRLGVAKAARSPRYGTIVPSMVVSFSGVLTLPATMVFILCFEDP